MPQQQQHQPVIKPNMKASPVLSKDVYKPRVHIIGGDSGLENKFTSNGYRVMPAEHKSDFSWADTDIAVFTGGCDIHPKFYGEPFAGANTPNVSRDEEEIDWFHCYEGIPKVGVCRGMQLLNILNGGKLIQHAGGHYGDHKLVDKWKTEVRTSSVHHQICIPGPGAEVIGWSVGQSIPGSSVKDPEVMRWEDSHSFGVQGHPEWGPQAFTDYFFIMMKFFVLPTVIKNLHRNISGKSEKRIVH